MKKAWILVGLIMAILMFSLGGSLTHAQLPSKILPFVSEKLQTQDAIKVEVYLKNPKTDKILSEAELNQVASQVNQKKISETFPEGFIAELTKKEIENLAKQPEVEYITPSLTLVPFLEDSVQIIDADLAWEKQINGLNLDGTTQTIAIIDTGVNFSHPDLTEKNIIGANVDCNQYPCQVNPSATDTNGHGTHVAGIAGAAGGINGIGKGANLISLKIYDDATGSIEIYKLKRALTWINLHAEEYHITTVVVSVGTIEQYSDYCDGIINPGVTQEINQAISNGISVTIATGNYGSSTTISFPACITSAIGVGATNKDDTRRPTSNYNQLMKLFAPGGNILSTCYTGGYCIKSGTSMASPMVAGAISIINQFLEQTNQQMTPAEIENLLYETGRPVTEIGNEWSRINVNNAILAIENIAPEVTLITPLNGATLHKNQQYTAYNGYKFTCSASDWNNLQSVKLKIFNTAGDLIYEQTNNIDNQSQTTQDFFVPYQILRTVNPKTTLNNYAEFLVSPQNTYQWNCQATDANSNIGSAPENFYFSI